MRILVVEDEPRMAALMRQGLEEEAYAVDVVGNGLEVIEWLQSAEYDIVLLDINCAPKASRCRF
jgi:DNA-binding response OmpR family regulator